MSRTSTTAVVLGVLALGVAATLGTQGLLKRLHKSERQALVGPDRETAENAAPVAAAPRAPATSGHAALPTPLATAAVSASPPEASESTPAEPAPEFDSGSEDVEFKLAELETTGSGSGEWVGTARGMVERWASAARDASVGFATKNWRCFAGGCSFEATYDSMESGARAEQLLTSSDAFVAYQGIKYRYMPPVKPGETIDATWILYSPEQGDAHETRN